MSVPRPQRRLAPIVCLLAAALALGGAAPSQADVGQKIIRLCAEGKSLSGFPPSDYAKALKEISATTEEYSDCGQLIRQAQLAASSGRAAPSIAGIGGVPQSIAATPAEQRALEAAAGSAPPPVQLEGQSVRPGVVHADIASALSSLPTPVLALLAFLLALLLVLGGGVLRKRIRERRAG